jgi:uncharacterized membrane protein YgaE (UPF0421/DUF939 family)
MIVFMLSERRKFTSNLLQVLIIGSLGPCGIILLEIFNQEFEFSYFRFFYALFGVVLALALYLFIVRIVIVPRDKVDSSTKRREET